MRCGWAMAGLGWGRRPTRADIQVLDERCRSPGFLCPVGAANDERLVAPPPILAFWAFCWGLCVGRRLCSVARNRTGNWHLYLASERAFHCDARSRLQVQLAVVGAGGLTG